jgi:hypothetical protein
MKLYTCEWQFISGKKIGCKCGVDANSSEFGFFCNRHHRFHINKVNIEQKTKNVIQNWNEMHDQLYKKYKVSELKKMLIDKKKSITGTKKILVDRLVQLDSLI